MDKIQQNVDLGSKEKDDHAAAIQLVFGEASLLKRPKVLTYAWVNMDVPEGTVIHSPRSSTHVRTIILNTSSSPLSTWQMHQRNIVEDYKTAFGEAPKKALSTVGFFTDNDQTKNPVTAYYKVPLLSAGGSQ